MIKYLLPALGLLLLAGGKRSSHPAPAGVRTISTTLSATNTKAKIYLPPSGSVIRELVVYLHGDNTKPSSLDEITARHDLAAQIARCYQGSRRRQTAWVAPYSTGKCDHFNELFSSPAKARAFFDGVLSQITAQGFSVSSDVSLVLVGQSRGRVPVRKLLTLLDDGEPVYGERTREVYLFDALYSADEAFAQFAVQPETRFWTAYGVATEKGAQQLYKSIKSRTSKGVYSDLDLGGSALPKINKAAPSPVKYQQGAGLFQCFGFTEAEKQQPIGFVSSPVEHKYTSRNYLAALLS